MYNNILIMQILNRFYSLQEVNGTLTPPQKDSMVKELISAYDTIALAERGDLLVPARGEFLEDHALDREEVASKRFRYTFNYKWPHNRGFLDNPDIITIGQGSVFDRVGPPSGMFLAKLDANNQPITYWARAIPYYVPEDDISQSPAYHKYRFDCEYGDLEKILVKSGIIAQAFWKHAGGGEQIELPVKISMLLGLGGIISEL